jgi:hypothetical protein
MGNTVCHVCGNKYTNLEIDYCMGCGAVIGKKRAEYLGEPITRWDKIKEAWSKIHWSEMVVMPRYDLTITKPKIPKKLSAFAKSVRLWRPQWAWEFTEEWRNHVKLPHKHQGQTCLDPKAHGCGLPKKFTKKDIPNMSYHERKDENGTWIRVTDEHLGKPLPKNIDEVRILNGQVMAGGRSQWDTSPWINSIKSQMDVKNDLVTLKKHAAGVETTRELRPQFVHSNMQRISVEYDGTIHELDYVTNMDVSMSNTAPIVGYGLGTDTIVHNNGPPTEIKVRLQMIFQPDDMSFWKGLMGQTCKLTINVGSDNTTVIEGTPVNIMTKGKAGEFLRGEVDFLGYEYKIVPTENLSAGYVTAQKHILIEQLEKDYPFLTIDDHPCDDPWEEVGNHVVCVGCGRMMVTNLPDKPALEDRRGPPPNKGQSSILGVAMDSGEDGDQVRVQQRGQVMTYHGASTQPVLVNFNERYGPVVRRPSAHVRLEDL